MKRFFVRSVALTGLVGAIVVCASVDTTVVRADEDIKKAMSTINKAPKGQDTLCKMLKTGVDAKEPKWDELAVKVKVVVPLAKSMVKAKPPYGNDESWEKFSTAYAKAAEDLETAVSKKDQKAAQTAMGTIANCMGCHTAHRNKPKDKK